MNIVIEGASRLDSSYGLVNVHLAAALARLGHRVTLAPWDQPEASCRDALGAAFGPSRSPFEVSVATASPDVRIRQIWPPVWSRPADNAALVVIQPWEFGSVQLSWLKGIAEADAVFVPSTYVKAGYVQSGIDPGRVWVIPNGTDLSVPLAPLPPSQPGAARELLFVGGGIFRKGVDVLIGALDGLEDAALSRLALTIKESGHDSYYAGQSLVDQSLAAAPRVASRTRVLRTQLPRASLQALYTKSQLLVHPYRSEGFALPVLEAMACGLPVLVTKGGATDDFCQPAGAVFVDSAISVQQSPYVDNALTVDLPYFREPSREQLTALLGAFAGGDFDLEAARENAWKTAQELTWDHVARRADSALACVLAKTPASDAFSEAAAAVDAAISRPENGGWIDGVHRLVRVGDLKSAALVAERALEAEPFDLRLASTLRQLRSAAGSHPDLWSAARWRLDLATAQRERASVRAVVHRHEGDAEAVAAIARAISPYLSGCPRVLDLGCGKGAMMRTLRAEGVDVVGIEGDPRLVGSLRAEGFEVHEGWIPRDLSLVGERRFDGIFMGHIIEHLPTDQAMSVLEWSAEHLDDGGTLVIQTPDFSLDVVSGSNFWLDPTHVRPYPLALLSGMLESAGFSPLVGGCRSLAPHAPLDVLAVGRLGRRAGRAPGTAFGEPRTAPLRVVHFGLFSSQAGMAQASRALLDERQLAERGIETVRVDLESSAPTSDAGTLSFSEALEVSGDLAIVDVPIGWLPEVLPKVRAGRRVVRLAYEATPLPRYLVDALAGVDAIWAMSRFVLDAAVASGLDEERLFLVPPGVPVRADAEAGFAGTAAGTRSTVFSAVFSFEPRKNPEALLRAFLALLDRELDVELVVKTSMIDDATFWQWTQALFGRADTVRLQCTSRILTGSLPQDELAELVRRSDAFVLPTRGEGFGFPFLEAMAAGVPVVCPDVGGHRDFCDEETSFLVETALVPCAAAWSIPVFRESWWREVEFEDLVRQMERVVTDPQLVRKKAASSLERARRCAESDPRSLTTEIIGKLTGRAEARAGDSAQPSLEAPLAPR